MKVKRVVINDGQLHAGVVFDTGPNTVGRAIVDLPADACAAILAAAQVAFDEGASAVSQEVQSTALTAELHRLRSTRQDLNIVQRDHAAALDENAKRIAETRGQLEAKRAEAEAAAAKAKADAAALVAEANETLQARRKALADAEAEGAAKRAELEADLAATQEEILKANVEKDQLQKEIDAMERTKRLTSLVNR